MGIARDIIMKVLPMPMRLPVWYRVKQLSGTIDEEIFYVKSTIAPGGVMLDIGANIGIYAYAFRNHCRAVHAFEPQPNCAKVVEAFGSPKIKVYPVALSDEAGALDLHIPRKNGSTIEGLASFRPLSGDFVTEKVPVKTLDSFNFTGVTILKIDVEGYEMNVLRGAGETILREKPCIIIEVEQCMNNRPVSEVFDHITALGYRGGFLLSGVWHSIEEFDVARYQQPFQNDIEAEQYRKLKGAYVNNFIFQPAKDC